MDTLALLPEILASAIRLSIPLIFACLAGLWSERSGIVDIGLEGKMLAAAFAAASAAFVFESAWIGLVLRVDRFNRAGAGAWLCIDHPSRQPDHLGRGDQHAGGRAYPGARRQMVQRGRSHPCPRSRSNASCRSRCRAPRACVTFRSSARSMATSSPARRCLPILAFLCVPITAYALARTRFGLRLARGRRESACRRHGGNFGFLAALSRRDHLRAAVRLRRRLSVDRAIGRLHQGHDGRQGLHCAGRSDLCQLARLSGDGRVPALRLSRRDGDPPAGRRTAGHRRGAGVRPSRRCPMC